MSDSAGSSPAPLDSESTLCECGHRMSVHPKVSGWPHSRPCTFIGCDCPIYRRPAVHVPGPDLPLIPQPAPAPLDVLHLADRLEATLGKAKARELAGHAGRVNIGVGTLADIVAALRSHVREQPDQPHLSAREAALRIAETVADEYGRQTGDDLDTNILVEALGRARLLLPEVREQSDHGLREWVARQMFWVQKGKKSPEDAVDAILKLFRSSPQQSDHGLEMKRLRSSPPVTEGPDYRLRLETAFSLITDACDEVVTRDGAGRELERLCQLREAVRSLQPTER